MRSKLISVLFGLILYPLLTFSLLTSSALVYFALAGADLGAAVVQDGEVSVTLRNLDRAPITEIVIDFAVAATTLTIPIGPILGYVAADAALNFRGTAYARGISWIIGIVPATAIVYFSSQVNAWPAALFEVGWQATTMILAAGLTGWLIVWRVGRQLDMAPVSALAPRSTTDAVVPPTAPAKRKPRVKKTVDDAAPKSGAKTKSDARSATKSKAAKSKSTSKKTTNPPKKVTKKTTKKTQKAAAE